jgi:hypothetical protein
MFDSEDKQSFWASSIDQKIRGCSSVVERPLCI